jgi:hypothetical protein
MPPKPPRLGKHAQSLANSISRHMVTNESQQKKFLPQSVFTKLITETEIKKCLPKAPPNLLHFVITRARTIFAILVYVDISGHELHSTLEKLLMSNYSDEMLPLREMDCKLRDMFDDEGSENLGTDSSDESEDDNSESSCSHNTAWDIFHDWGDARFHLFCESQWKFLSPVFSNEKMIYYLDPESILPIVELGSGKGEGHFAMVKEAYLRWDHQESFKTVGVILVLSEESLC